MIPRASIRGSLWRRVLAILRRRLRPSCGICAEFASGVTPQARKTFHDAHRYVERTYARVGMSRPIGR